MTGLLGAWSETMDATEDIQKICVQVKGQAEKKVDKKYVEFKAVKYRDQLVAGKNYVIKVQVGEKDYIQLSLFQDLPCNGGKIVVLEVQPMTKDGPLLPFP